MKHRWNIPIFAISMKQKLHMLCCCWIMMSIQRNLIQPHAYYFSTLLEFPIFISSLELKSRLIYPSDMFIWVSCRHLWLNMSKTDSWFFLSTYSSLSIPQLCKVALSVCWAQNCGIILNSSIFFTAYNLCISHNCWLGTTFKNISTSSAVTKVEITITPLLTYLLRESPN